jgi:ATP-dependent exoDNAse (exonuclease V) alpha subunit
MTASDPEFIASTANVLLSSNRLNVAISRARTKAVIACSPSVLTALPSDYSAYRGQQLLRRVLHRARNRKLG